MDEGEFMESVNPTEAELLKAENKHLRAVIDLIDTALCNYVNECSDPYTPPSQWDDSCKAAFRALCAEYEAWHNVHQIPDEG